MPDLWVKPFSASAWGRARTCSCTSRHRGMSLNAWMLLLLSIKWKKKNNEYVLLSSLKFQLLSEIPPSLYSQMYTPDPSSANEEPPSLVPVTHPTRLPFVSVGGAGVRGGGNWPSLLRWKQASCLGTQNRLSVCVCSAARSKGHAMFRHTHTHEHKHTHTLRDLFTHPLAPDNQCSYLGKVIICSCVCLLAFRALSCRLWGETETVASLLDSLLLGFTVILPDYQTNMIPLPQTSDFNNLLQLTDIDQVRKRRWFQSLFFFLS